MLKVAVSGVGGGVGQSIMKALKISSLPVEIYPIDIQPLSAGLYRGVKGLLLPKPESPGALDVWDKNLRDHGIEALIPGSDHDLLPLSAIRNSWESEGKCKILVSDSNLIKIGRDKAETCLKLQKEGIPTPRSAWDLSLKEAGKWARATGYPIIIKPRSGFASKKFHVLKDDKELNFYFPRTPNPILQEYLNLNNKEEEFTCAVFVDRDGSPVGTFMAKRELSAGTTYRAEINFWQEIHELLLNIGSVLRPRGPLNVQLRLTERGPIPFELNIRCSGTAAIRAYFGYNEPEMLLRHYVLNEHLEPPKTRTGCAFRYWDEVFLDGIDQESLSKGPDNLKGKVLTWL